MGDSKTQALSQVFYPKDHQILLCLVHDKMKHKLNT